MNNPTLIKTITWELAEAIIEADNIMSDDPSLSSYKIFLDGTCIREATSCSYKILLDGTVIREA